MKWRLRRLVDDLRQERAEVEAARRETRETVHLLADQVFQLQAATEELKHVLSQMGESIDDR